MTANELMIGDYVEHIEGSTPIQIEEIHTDGVIFSNVCYLPYDEIKPIPLTAEILERNFNGADPYGFYFFGDEYIEVYIKEYTDGLWRVEVDEVEMSGLPSWRMYVSDVHQLQHALRLCNIDKEVEL